MSAAIRPPLDICPDRIRLKQSPGPHVRDFVHACVAHWCAGCMPHAQCGGLRKIMARQMTFEMKCNTSTHTHTHTDGGAVHFLTKRVTAAPNLFAIWLICRFFLTLLLQITQKEKWWSPCWLLHLLRSAACLYNELVPRSVPAVRRPWWQGVPILVPCPPHSSVSSRVLIPDRRNIQSCGLHKCECSRLGWTICSAQ